MKGLVTVGKSGSGNEVMGMGTLITKKKKKVKGMETATTFESNNRKIKLILQYQIEKKKIFSQKKK